MGLSTYTFEKQRNESIEAGNTQLGAETERLDEALEVAKTHAQVRYEKRLQWIDRAWKNSKRNFLSHLEESEGHSKYSIQKTMLDTERNHKTALSHAETEYEEFQQAIRRDRGVFYSLASLATKSFRGYPGFKKTLSAG